MTKTGVMICGHGSRSQAAVDEFAVLARKLPPLLPNWPVEYGYLEFANPVLRDGLDRLREKGCDRILAVPGMLFAAMHAKNDIPSVLNTYAKKHGHNFAEVQQKRAMGIALAAVIIHAMTPTHTHWGNRQYPPRSPAG